MISPIPPTYFRFGFGLRFFDLFRKPFATRLGRILFRGLGFRLLTGSARSCPGAIAADINVETKHPTSSKRIFIPINPYKTTTTTGTAYSTILRRLHIAQFLMSIQAG